MTDETLEETYKLIEKYHNKYLKEKGVRLPKLKDNNGRYTKDALVLVKLAENYPNTKIISKQELTSFVRKYYPDVSDVQQARHLGMQRGWNIVSGTRGDNGEKVPSGSYKLIDLENSYPAFAPKRRVGFDTDDFEQIKKEYGYKCVSCGTKEGEEHFFRKGVIVKLQKGHMNPSKPLVAGNIIPQCQICNRADRNRWIYDKTGRVIEVAETSDGVRIVKAFLQKASNKVKWEIFLFLKNLLR
ncbi:MAG: hypothetical protein LBR81_03200 [Prevotellaceae bacterium]|jgi:hypothetical protein|nr:hypothetical protein [Prevotellaceae bacterium]